MNRMEDIITDKQFANKKTDLVSCDRHIRLQTIFPKKADTIRWQVVYPSGVCAPIFASDGLCCLKRLYVDTRLERKSFFPLFEAQNPKPFGTYVKTMIPDD